MQESTSFPPREDRGAEINWAPNIKLTPLPFPEADLMHIWDQLEAPERQRLESIRTTSWRRWRLTGWETCN